MCSSMSVGLPESVKSCVCGDPCLYVLRPQILMSGDPKIFGKIAFILNMYRHDSLHLLSSAV